MGGAITVKEVRFVPRVSLGPNGLLIPTLALMLTWPRLNTAKTLITLRVAKVRKNDVSQGQ